MWKLNSTLEKTCSWYLNTIVFTNSDQTTISKENTIHQIPLTKSSNILSLMAGIDLFRSFRCNTNRTGRKEPPAVQSIPILRKEADVAGKKARRKKNAGTTLFRGQQSENVKDWIITLLKEMSQSQNFRNRMGTSHRNRSPNFTNGKIWCLKRMRRQTTDWEKIFAKTQVTKDCYLKHTHKELFKLNNFLKIWFRSGLKTSTDTSPKTHKWQISMWKDTLYNMSSGKHKLKQQWVITTHLLKWQKSPEHRQNQMLTRCEATGTFFHCWWECKMVQPTLEDSLAVFTKLNIVLLYNQQSCFLVFTQIS